MQMPNSANVVDTRSAAVLRRTAETMPSGNATRTDTVIASRASCRLGRRRRLSFSITGSPLRIERPRSPRTTRAIQRAYWTWMGWSSPSSRRRCAFTAGSADSAIIVSMGSPGVRCSSAKTPSVTSRSTGTVAASRCRTSRPKRLSQPDVLEAHHTVGDRVVALGAWAERLWLDGMNDDHHRQLGRQEPRQLAIELLALRLARDLAAPVEQQVDLLVREPGPVERRARGGLEELVRVAVRIGPAAPLEADHVEILRVAVGDERGGIHELDLHRDASLAELGLY